MNRVEKIALLSFILFVSAMFFAEEHTSQLFWLFFACIAASEFLSNGI